MYKFTLMLMPLKLYPDNFFLCDRKKGPTSLTNQAGVQRPKKGTKPEIRQQDRNEPRDSRSDNITSSEVYIPEPE